MGQSARQLRVVRQGEALNPLARVESELERLARGLSRPAGSALSPLSHTLGAYLLRPGKRVRARLCLAGEALFLSGPPSPAACIGAAVLETIHAFLLIHDDVMDRAELRRGAPALHVSLRPAGGEDREKTGEDLAVVSGDWLYTLALRELLRLPVSPSLRLRLADMLLEVCAMTAEGQALDVVNGLEPLSSMSLEGVLETYRLKTARYTFEAPLLCGALIAGASFEALERLRRFSSAAGVAFQLVDDLLGLYASDAQLGKPAVSDLAEGKKTWPLVRAFALLPEPEGRWLEALLASKKAGACELDSVRQLVRGCGAFDEALALVHSLLGEAREELSGFRPGEARNELQRLLDSLESTAGSLSRPLSLSPHAP